MNRHLILTVIILSLFALIAFALQDIVWNGLILPALYQLWLTWIFLRSMPQVVFWNFFLVLVALIALISLVRRKQHRPPPADDVIRTLDPVASLAKNIQDIHKGNFFKWVVANRFGTLARSILFQQTGASSLPARRLVGRDWNPPADVQAYLETGLARSFIEQPRKWFFFRSRKSPLDIDLDRVVEYLESQVEIDIEH